MSYHSTSTAAIRIEDVMTRKIVTISPEETVEKAVEIMMENDFECLPVTKEKTLLGIITFRDIVSKVVYGRKDATKTRTRDIMSERLITCHSDTTVLEVAKLMKSKRVRRVPVVDRSKRLVGLVTTFDLAMFGWGSE